jgi:hypothetical protein
MRRCTAFRRVLEVGTFAITIVSTTPTELRWHDHIEIRPGFEFVTNVPGMRYANGSNTSGRALAGAALGSGRAFDGSINIDVAA